MQRDLLAPYLLPSPCRIFLPILLFLRNKILSPQPINHQLLPFCPPINVPHVVRSRLEMARSVVTLADENLILVAAIQRLVARERRALEFLFDFAEACESGLEFKVVVCRPFGDGGDDGDVVPFGADGVSG